MAFTFVGGQKSMDKTSELVITCFKAQISRLLSVQAVLFLASPQTRSEINVIVGDILLCSKMI